MDDREKCMLYRIDRLIDQIKTMDAANEIWEVRIRKAKEDWEEVSASIAEGLAEYELELKARQESRKKAQSVLGFFFEPVLVSETTDPISET
jgi:hypothetical protein